jgi:hypothetical protein
LVHATPTIFPIKSLLSFIVPPSALLDQQTFAPCAVDHVGFDAVLRGVGLEVALALLVSNSALLGDNERLHHRLA